VSGAAWHQRDERGSVLALRVSAWLYRNLGHAVARVLVAPIVAYFYATGASARRASLAFLRRVHASPGGAVALPAAPGQRDVFRHFLAFGVSILDRIGFWLGRLSDYRLEVKGDDHLKRVVADGRGALVLGSHLGSFDAMRLLATTSPITVSVLMYTEHAARINDLFERLAVLSDATLSRVRVIPVRGDGFDHVLAARACIERGEVVAILADRTPPSGAGRSCEVAFLGGRAAIPQGPFRLAAALRCPLLFMVALRTGERAYAIDVEWIADRVVLPRAERDAALAALCQDYADRLAVQCLRAPHQWFNFYEFFRDSSEPARV
jgi:predicted LPLAT superfamily acyltransferase